MLNIATQQSEIKKKTQFVVLNMETLVHRITQHVESTSQYRVVSSYDSYAHQ